MTAGTPHAPGPPSTGVVIAGALAVAVVVLFVMSVVVGTTSRPEPGDRVAVARSDDAATGYEVVVGRCDDERVRAIAVLDQQGAPLWRVEAAKGSFERRFPLGEAAFGFAEVVPLRGLPDGKVEVTVAVGDDVDAEVIDLRDVGDDVAVGASCGGSSVGSVGWLFAAGAAVVVLSYGAMLFRYRRDRRR